MTAWVRGCYLGGMATSHSRLFRLLVDSIVTSRFRQARGSLAVLLLAGLGVSTAGRAVAEPPTAEAIQGGHKELEAAAQRVQGRIRGFRIETPRPAALESAETPDDIPLVLIGSLWRSPERFRANYRTVSPQKGASELRNSVALDGDRGFELSPGLASTAGMLRVYEPGAAEGAASRLFISSQFYESIDSLWFKQVAGLLQARGTSVEASPRLAEGTLVKGLSEGTLAQLHVRDAAPHPLVFVSASAGSGDQQIKIERRIDSKRHAGKWTPVRVVAVVSIGKIAGYTEITELTLTPLETGSPIDGPITAASFRDMGYDYQVYLLEGNKPEQLKERYRALGDPPGE